jgi:tetratricopeptide (TPR) repeat protein
MTIRGRISLVFAVMALGACTPRPVVLPPPPPPPAPVQTPEEIAAERAARARQLWNEGTQLGRQGRWAQAERAYREAATLQPDSATYQMALSTALLQMGRDSEAADALLAAIRIEEAAQPVNHAVIAVDYERAIQILERVGRLDEARTARDRQRFHRMMRDTGSDTPTPTSTPPN